MSWGLVAYIHIYIFVIYFVNVKFFVAVMWKSLKEKYKMFC